MGVQGKFRNRKISKFVALLRKTYKIKKLIKILIIIIIIVVVIIITIIVIIMVRSYKISKKELVTFSRLT